MSKIIITFEDELTVQGKDFNSTLEMLAVLRLAEYQILESIMSKCVSGSFDESEVN